ncbi:MAG: S46 family peptidase, partial [Acidobacteriaceae bacterium]|nr:S46 family peptidase [Acidobacteriaceae bacterium]
MARFACADEGMWTFDNLPVQDLQSKYGLAPSPQWLEHLRLSCVRINDGGSGSFISADGLLLTNHHVARGQLQKSSSAEHDYIRNGFYARTRDQEIKSPDLEVDVLVSMQNVTDEISHRISGIRNEQEQATARRAAIGALEEDSNKATGLQSQLVTLYGGGEYWLYRYKRYTDVRIVFAPEEQAAFFGGDPDNFTYPRYDLDLAIFRVYENGKPIHTNNYLKWNSAGAKDGELVFVAGNPGHTYRSYTLAQYKMFVRATLPELLSERQARVTVDETYAQNGAEQARQAGSAIFSLQNSIKAFSGAERAG